MSDEINIVGKGQGFEYAPNDNCWGTGRLIFKRSNVDVLFDMHSKSDITKEYDDQRNEIIKKTNELNIPVFSCEEIENTTYMAYPIRTIVRHFKTAFFSNTICYMIALALYQGYRKINLYGANQNTLEYYLEKCGVDYWIGRAQQSGVECTVHGPLSVVGKTASGKVYGYNISYDEMLEKHL